MALKAVMSKLGGKKLDSRLKLRWVNFVCCEKCNIGVDGVWIVEMADKLRWQGLVTMVVGQVRLLSEGVVV